MNLLELADEVRAVADWISTVHSGLKPWPDSYRDGANAYLILREWAETLREDGLDMQAAPEPPPAGGSDAASAPYLSS